MGEAIALEGTRVTRNRVTDGDSHGGGIGALTAHIVDSEIARNEGAIGGGIWSWTLDMEASTVSDNVASDSGGGFASGFAASADVASIRRSTITGNAAPAGVGGLDFSEANPAQSRLLEDVTLAGNTGTTDALAPGPSLQVKNSVIAGDGGGLCTNVIAVESLGHNAGTDACGLDDGTDLAIADPLLGPLTDNGGPTRSRRPLPGSPLIDAGGTCGATDQRGLTRPVGPACDIGAIEANVLTPTFADVGPGDPFFAEIECLVDLDVTSGYSDGTFRPALSITRQAVVAWLWRLAGSPPPSGPPTFSDVPASHPFAPAIAWAAEEELVSGFPDGTFRPGLDVSRQALAAWLWRQAGEPAPAGDPPFSDVSASARFADAIAWLAEVGITNGFSDGTFRPNASITRQAVAAWVCRAHELAA
jgi:hypothetical protein